jgi:ABC-2 type transport system ATP-binding protein
VSNEPRTLISVRDVTMRFPLPKRYREWILTPFKGRRLVTALSNASLQIQTGDRVAVMGPNGAGKTTLLKLIGGVLFPTAGEIIVNGFNTVHDSGSARRSVGFVFNEERSFFWRLTGVQNLEFFGTLDNIVGDALQERIQHLIHLVGLETYGDKMVSAYSSGMKQRLAVARALIADPDVLILDEPTRALDPVACDQIVDLILAELHQRAGKTLLIATHRPDEAMLLCNKVMIVHSGSVRAFNSISDITERGSNILQHYRECLTQEMTDEVSAL